MKQPHEFKHSHAQEARMMVVLELLEDGPKSTEHLAKLLGINPDKDIKAALTMLLSKMPVWFDEDFGKWRVIETPREPPRLKFIRYRGSPLIRGMDWNGVGGIRALWG